VCEASRLAVVSRQHARSLDACRVPDLVIAAHLKHLSGAAALIEHKSKAASGGRQTGLFGRRLQNDMARHAPFSASADGVRRHKRVAVPLEA
jgi:hypothetical protein